VCVQHERAAAAGAARDRDDVRPAGSELRERRLEAGPLAPLRDEPRQRELTGAAFDDVRVDRLDRDELRCELGDFAQVLA
jgi:hypothetical protein